MPIYGDCTMTNSNTTSDDHRKTVGEWLDLPFEWRIPVYQRHYAWDAKKSHGPIDLFWKTVQEQAESLLTDKEIPRHYLGAILVDDKKKNQLDPITPFNVVDGQQRLTTIQIALLAIAQLAKQYECDDIIEELHKYVYSPEGSRTRLNPTNFDQEQFKEVVYWVYGTGTASISHVNHARQKNSKKSKVMSAFNYFCKNAEEFVKKHSKQGAKLAIDAIKRALLEKFDLVLIVLHKDDNAQQVFESLNNYGERLTTFDLIRNNVFYRATHIEPGKEPGKDQELFDGIWQQLENPDWEDKANRKNTHIEAYIARMLAAKTGKEFNFNTIDIFNTYKEFAVPFGKNIDEEVRQLMEYTDIYKYLGFPPEKAGENPVPDMNFGIFRFDIWNNIDYYPVLFMITGSETLNTTEKQRMVNLLESYVIRRRICALSMEYYNLHAIEICKHLSKKNNYNTLFEVLKNAEGRSTLFPDNNMVTAECTRAKFYGSSQGSINRHIFCQLEISMNDSPEERGELNINQLSLDHILPQKWDKNSKWKDMVLVDNTDEADVPGYIHTLGNLTLMSGPNNARKSNGSLEEFYDYLKNSAMALNRELAEELKQDFVWNLDKIRARSQKLGKKICEIWPEDIK